MLLAKDGARVVAFDARGHGATICENEALDPLLLVADLVAIVAAVRRDVDQEIVLIGHSMGASIVVSAANSIPNVVAAGVIDVVEGTAIESLSHMHSVLRNRPAKFRSTDDAIKWSLRSHLLQNKESAKISVPHLLKRLAGEPPVFTWRTDLAASEPYWKSWFEGLSSRFLAMKCARLLVLAGADRLDKELTIGQMQGKFQVVVYPESWHYVQEDVPDKLAETLTEFWTRNQKLVTIKRFPIPIKPAAATVGATAPQE
ncbi:Protein phosphatase methylesterase 1 [Physocladia obscura]|uniref:Protein phosphatase methylesterase 1 n=1 Tax=Physocladia obscura TaxID=109957 RepID=A0AAD5XHT4_9FUNG|nr:Protein phosphatase methylesterase 1 [Physocladia obscura]